MPYRRSVVSPGSTSTSTSSTMTAVTAGSRPVARSDRSAEPGRGPRAGRPAAPGRAARRAGVRGRVRWSDSVGSGSVTQRFCSGGPQDHLPADADRGRLRPGDQRRHLDPQVLLGPRPAGQPPAGAQLVRAERARVEPGHRRRRPRRPASGTSCTCRARRRWSRRRCRSSSRRRTAWRPAGTRTSRRPGAVGVEADAHPVRRGRLGVRRVVGRPLTGRPRSAAASPPRPPRAVRAIHAAPQSSLPSIRSAALTASTICGARTSMIAVVSPDCIAIGRNDAPSACRPGMPNETLHAPSVMFTPNSSRISSMVSSVFLASVESAPTGIASGSMTMSSSGIS